MQTPNAILFFGFYISASASLDGVDIPESVTLALLGDPADSDEHDPWLAVAACWHPLPSCAPVAHTHEITNRPVLTCVPVEPTSDDIEVIGEALGGEVVIGWYTSAQPAQVLTRGTNRAMLPHGKRPTYRGDTSTDSRLSRD
jgi:hypothetical protein